MGNELPVSGTTTDAKLKDPPTPTVSLTKAQVPGADLRSEQLELSRTSSRTLVASNPSTTTPPTNAPVTPAQVRKLLADSLDPRSSSPSPDSYLRSRPEASEILSQIVLNTRETPAIRAAAIKALGSLEKEENIALITTVMSDKNAPDALRIAAVKSLGSYMGSIQVRAATTLGTIARDPTSPPALREEAIKTLSNTGHIDAARELIKVIQQFSPDSSTGRLAARGVGDLIYGASAIASDIHALLKQSPKDVQDSLLPGLSRCKDPESKAILSAALRDSKVSDKTKITILQNSMEQDADMLAPMQELVSSSKNPDVRLSALTSMITIAVLKNKSDDPSFRATIEKLANDPTEIGSIRVIATKMAGTYKNDKDAALLLLVENKTLPDETRRLALAGITAETPAVRQTLRTLAEDGSENPMLRIASANSLGRIDRSEGTALLTKLIDSGKLDANQKRTALDALAQSKGDQAVERVIEDYGKGTMSAADAVGVLTSAKSAKAVPTLIKLLEDTSLTYGDRKAIVEALGRLGDRKAMPTLSALTKDPLLGDTATVALAQLGQASAIQTIAQQSHGGRNLYTDSREALMKSPDPSAAALLALRMRDLPLGEASVAGRELDTKLSLSEKLAFGKRLQEAAKQESDPEKKKFLDEYGKAIVSALEDCDIENPFRCSPSFLIKAVKERTNPQVDNRPLAVVAIARSDDNGFLENGRDQLDKLERAGYRIMYYEVATDKNLVKSMQEATAQGQKADVVIMMGHGSQTALALGGPDPRLSDRRVTNDATVITPDDEKLLNQANSAVKPGGTIVMISCSLGEGEKGANNVANMLRRAFPNAGDRRIFTATDPTRMPDIKYDPKTGAILDVNFSTPGYQANSPGSAQPA